MVKEKKTLAMNNKAFDILKWVVGVVLPAVGTLYFTLGELWGFPNITEVLGTIVAVEVALGTILGVSNHSYKKNDLDKDGEVYIDTDDGLVYYPSNIEFDYDINPNRRDIKLKVVKPGSQE